MGAQTLLQSWFHQKGRNIAGLMDDLPFVLHSDLSSCCYKSVIENVSHLMNYCNLGHDNNNNNNNNNNVFWLTVDKITKTFMYILKWLSFFLG